MRWRTRQPGDRRTRFAFAWLPTLCDDGTTRWFERLQIVEKWQAGRWVAAGMHYFPPHWERVSTLPASGVHEVPP